jgi:hypothetical protein
MCNNLVPLLQKTYSFSIIMTSWLMPYMELITDYFKYHAQNISTLCGKMQKFLMLYQVHTYLPLRFKGLKINLQICYLCEEMWLCLAREL